MNSLLPSILMSDGKRHLHVIECEISLFCDKSESVTKSKSFLNEKYKD